MTEDSIEKVPAEEQSEDASAERTPTAEQPAESEQYAALREKLMKSNNDTGTVAEALGRRNFLFALVWIALIALAFTFEQLKTRWEYWTVERKNQLTQDLSDHERKEVTTPSGLKYTDLKLGAGPIPQRGDLLLLEYTLSLLDGTKVASSRDRNQKALGFTFGAGAEQSTLIPQGLLEGIGSMHKGGKRRLVVPPELGFGDQEVFFPDVTVVSHSTLIYDVELVKVSIAPS
ncbi:MAG: FKBP-type peptidyl-prolyl cis-trans isomerase [Thermosynechococcaceae cyanobacterium]